MAVDVRRMVVAAVEAALDEIQSGAQNVKEEGRRLRPGRAFLIGAGVVTAARLAVGPQARQLLESVQERLEEFVEDDEED